MFSFLLFPFFFNIVQTTSVEHFSNSFNHLIDSLSQCLPFRIDNRLGAKPFFPSYILLTISVFDFSREGGDQGKRKGQINLVFLLLFPFQSDLCFLDGFPGIHISSAKRPSYESSAKNIRSMLPLPETHNVSKINVNDANAVIPQSFSSESFCINHNL